MGTDNVQKGIILIVDDNPSNLGYLFKFLSDSGFKVLVATDGETALEQVEYAQHDLILLDIMMPGMDGFETCRRLKENPATKEIPVIFMSALSETVDKVKGFKLGAVDYITKPIQHEEVLVRVETHLTIRNLQKKLEDKNYRLQQEIIHRKRAEAVLQESEAKYRTLVEQIPAVTYIAALDDLCTKLYVSPRIKQMLGFTPQEWQGQRDLWIKQIYPEDCQGVLSKFYLSQSSGKPFCAEYRIFSKHGLVVWVRDEATLVRDSVGKPISFQGVMFNITAHKEAECALQSSEAQNRALLNAIPDLMYSINAGGVVIDYMAAKDEHIINSPEEFLNKNIAEIFSSDLAQWTMHFVKEALATGKVESGEYVQQVNGSWRCYDARYFAMEGDRVLVLVRDISERKQLASALLESQAELKNKTEQLEETLMKLRSTQSQ
ncbi:MAG: response regulator [Cyanobacteriota bacterium]|nr:response regulator [Cyanobacteriota bacterium]